MITWIRKQLEKTNYFKGWFIRRDFRRRVKKLDAHFDPLIATAKAANDRDAIDEYDGAYRTEYEELVVDWDEWESSTLLSRAREHFVHVPDRTEQPDFWHQTNYSYPRWESTYWGLERVRRDVRDAQRARNDEWRKWVTLFFAVVATALSIWSLRIKTKQPDPCQRNYYRNDAGECVYALHPAPNVNSIK